MSTRCPSCGRDAPLVYKGVVPSCSACGAARIPLTNRSVTHAGTPQKIGGTVAGVAGGLVIGGGLVLALVVGFLLHLIFAGSAAGLIAGGILAGFALLFGTLFLVGGSKLRRSGMIADRDVKVEALFAYAAGHGGRITSREAAAALAIPLAETDALLMDLAKTDHERVSLEIDDQGGLFYEFPEALPEGSSPLRLNEAGGSRNVAGREREEADRDAEEARARARAAAEAKARAGGRDPSPAH